jgi:PAS domain S-box-containing protein
MQRFRGISLVSTARPPLRLLAFVFLFCFAATALAQTSRHVLVLNSYEITVTEGGAIARSVVTTLEQKYPNAEIHVENMDARRIAQIPSYLDQLESVFRTKYSTPPLSVIVACDQPAFDFVLTRGKRLFPDVPIVFCGNTLFDESLLANRPTITGVMEHVDIRATLDMAMKLHPSARHVWIVCDDTPEGRARRAMSEACNRSFDGIEFDYLSGANLSLSELFDVLRTATDDCIVLFLDFRKDSTGRIVRIPDVFPLASGQTPVPIYTPGDVFLGHGVMGGVFVQTEEEGILAARMAIRLLSGESVANIPILHYTEQIPIFDHRQMLRFGLHASALPNGSRIVGKPHQFIDAYTRFTRNTWIVMVGLLLLVVVLALNILSRRRTETELRNSEERFRRYFELGVVGMAVANAGRRWILVNKRFCKMLGYSQEELTRKTWDDVTPAAEHAKDDEWLDSVLRGETGSHTLDRRFVKKNGKTLYGLVAVRALRYGLRAEETDLLILVLDVTDRRKDEQERRQLEARVQQTQKLESLGVLAGGIAHDFNNLLMGILGNADLALADLSPSSPIHASICDIEKAARRAADLCKQMLAYSGKGKFVIEKVNLNEAVEEMTHLLDVSISKRASLRFNFAPNLPSIEADATQLRQIIMNLITNASEAIGDTSGAIALTTGTMYCDRAYLESTQLGDNLPEGEYAFLEVSDNGCGMNADTMHRIFEPFFTTKFTGRGLGMAAVLGIVRGHKGAIKVFSELGIGTTFKVLFPHTGQQSIDRSTALPDVETTWQEGAYGPVLLIDDEPIVREVGARMLERLGFQVLLAPGGREGVECFRLEPNAIRFVLLDMTMPEMDGEATFCELQRIRPDVQVILCSGYNEQDIATRFTGKGLAGFIQKPYSKNTLEAALAKFTNVAKQYSGQTDALMEEAGLAES